MTDGGIEPTPGYGPEDAAKFAILDKNAKSIAKRRDQLRNKEAAFRRARLARRAWRLGALLVTMSLACATIITDLWWPSRWTLKTDALCGAVALSAGFLWLWATKQTHSLETPEADVEDARAEMRIAQAIGLPGVADRRQLYRQELSEVADGYQREADRYRRVHIWLQTIVIVGSLSTSTIAGLEGVIPNHRWIMTGLSFTVALAASLMGYFKFRERSYFLQQSADQISEEVGAAALHVGAYSGHADDEKVLQLLGERVEAVRNEQRRRQQQLDQPTEMNPSGSSSS